MMFFYIYNLTIFLCNIMVYLLGKDSYLLRNLVEAIRLGKEASRALNLTGKCHSVLLFH